ncbi:hypothetical protein [Flagellimonas sp.]|uniref:hypothetical protein n=1 Tax=Flagellimonas sp. TaxID=2058762 RepID=UPI003B50AF2C
MTKKNPFKSIEPLVSVPEELKEDIVQGVEEIIEEQEESSSDSPDLDGENTQ